MSLFRAELHIHSCLSPCADEDMTPCNLAGMASLEGIGIAALTDHNTAANCPAFFEACHRYGITPLGGMELTTAEDIHLICLFPTLEQTAAFDRAVRRVRMQALNRPHIFGRQLWMGPGDQLLGEDPWFLPAATAWTLEEGVRQARKLGGVCYPAHIDREANGLLVILGGFPQAPEFSTVELREGKHRPLARGRRMVTASDAHRLWEIGASGFSLYLPAHPGEHTRITGALLKYLEGKE